MPVMRGRIAPFALLVAFAFVVVGFLRADREMVRAENDRANLTASETATLVEVFVLRHLVELRSAVQLFGEERNESDPDGVKRTVQPGTFGKAFDRLWVTDSLGSVRHRTPRSEA